MKKVLIVLLFAFVFSVLNVLNVSVLKAAEDQHVSQTAKGKKLSDYVSVIYFHGDFRCSSCIKIEQYSRQTIEQYFGDELKSGELRFTVLNMDKPENKHFIKDYNLYTKSLVVVRFKNNKQVEWKNLEKIWQYLDNRDRFQTYVREEVVSFLEKE